MSKVQVHVDGVADMGRRFADAWRRAEAGELVVPETHVTFLGLDTMLATLTPLRLALLRHVRRHGARNTRELAASLGREYKQVNQDVAALEDAGLLLREGRRLVAPWDELQATVSLAAAA